MNRSQDFDFLNINAIYRQGGYFAPGPTTEWRLNSVEAFCQNKFYFATEGTFSITIEGTKYIAKPGDWFFIPAGVIHQYQRFPDKPMEKYWMHFDIYPSTNLLASLQVKRRVNVANEPQVWALFEEFGKLCHSNNLTDRLKVKAIILNLLAEYICLAGRQTNIFFDRQDEDMRNVLSYINENFRRNLTTEELAAVCHLHPTHFIRAFKLKTAQTPHRYITDIRMEYARQLLDRSNRSIVEIAEDAGFYDPAHFSRMFKRYFAMTPTQYRNALPIDR